MRSPFSQVDHAAQVATTTDERTLYVRVEGEFREMPGLTLTVRQAARLFSMEPARCERVLGALVHDGVLAAGTDGAKFARVGGRRVYRLPW
jgi:hypothetical protein